MTKQKGDFANHQVVMHFYPFLSLLVSITGPFKRRLSYLLLTEWSLMTTGTFKDHCIAKNKQKKMHRREECVCQSG